MTDLTFCVCSEDDNEEDIYVTCQWQSDDDISACYLLYRIVIAMYFFATWIVVIVLKDDLVFYDIYRSPTYFKPCFVDFFIIYFSFFGYTCCMVEKIWAALAVASSYFELECEETLLRSYPVYLSIQIVSQDFCLMTMFLYFHVYYTSATANDIYETLNILFSTPAVMFYIVLVVLNAFDAIIVAHYIPLCTFWIAIVPFVLITFCIYMDLVIIQRKCGRTVFKVTKKTFYNDYNGWPVVGFSFLYLLLGHLGFWILQALRDIVYEKCVA